MAVTHCHVKKGRGLVAVWQGWGLGVAGAVSDRRQRGGRAHPTALPEKKPEAQEPGDPGDPSALCLLALSLT